MAGFRGNLNTTWVDEKSSENYNTTWINPSVLKSTNPDDVACRKCQGIVFDLGICKLQCCLFNRQIALISLFDSQIALISLFNRQIAMISLLYVMITEPSKMMIFPRP